MHRATRPLLWAFVAATLLLNGCSWLAKDDTDQEQWSARRFYDEGKAQLNRNNNEEAIKLFEALEARFPYGRYAEQAQLQIAYAYYKSGETDAAIDAADRFIRLHPTHPAVDYAYYLKGLAHFSTKRGWLDRFGGELDFSDRDPSAARAAFDSFQQLHARFPQSRYAADARDRMRYLLNALARHDLRVARFYYDRGAFVATVNRAKYVVEHYQTTPAVEDALGLMALTYQQMNLDGLANDTLRVLRKNFPESVYVAQIEGRAAPDSERGFLARLLGRKQRRSDVLPAAPAPEAGLVAPTPKKKRGLFSRLWPFGKKDGK